MFAHEAIQQAFMPDAPVAVAIARLLVKDSLYLASQRIRILRDRVFKRRWVQRLWQGPNRNLRMISWRGFVRFPGILGGARDGVPWHYQESDSCDRNQQNGSRCFPK